MANQYINNMTALWNSAGTTYAAIKMNVTNAASSAASNLIQMQVGAVDKFTVDKLGSVTAAGIITATGGLVTAGTMLPAANDTAALGTSGTAWSDLFLASGGVINWAAGDITITHGTNQMLFGGASAGYSFDSPIKPSANDSTSIGQIGTAWSDIFLAVGSVIDFGTTDVTITHTTDTLTVGGGDFRVPLAGTNTASVVTVGAAQTLASKTLTSPVLNSPTINTPTITSPTITGTITAATLTLSGAISAAGSIATTSSVVASNFQAAVATPSQAILATNGSTAGNVFLRPNGAASATGQVSVNSAGTIVAAGSITAAGSVTATPTLSVKAASGNIHVWWNGPAGEDRAVIYTTAASAGHLNLRVNGTQTFIFANDGQFYGPSNVRAASAFLGTDGNISGSVWTNLGYGDAYTALVNRIESRAAAYMNNCVTNWRCAGEVANDRNGVSPKRENSAYFFTGVQGLSSGGDGRYYARQPQLFYPNGGWVAAFIF